VRYQLWIVLLGRDQCPLEDGDYIEVRVAHGPYPRGVAQIPVSLLEAMIVNHLETLAVQARLASHVGRRGLTDDGEQPSSRPEPYDAEQRAALRARRRSRKRMV
jgi:hypothetical protein